MRTLPPINRRLARRVPFFYGWIMLPIATLGIMATTPGQTYGVSLFNTAFRETLGLSHTQLTGAYAVGTFLASIPQSYIGALMDRFGIRRMMTAAVILLGLACVFISQATSLWMLFFGFLFLRMFGQGALSLLSTNTLAMWFDARLGTVQGIYMAGSAAAIAIFPPLILSLINSVGWRSAYIILGAAVCVVMLPLLLIAFHNRPEDLGQGLDGRIDPIHTKQDQPLPAAARSLTLPEAVRTPAYWIFLVMIAITGMIITAVFFNVLPLFETFGLDAAVVTQTFSVFAVSLAAMQLIGGVLADRLPLRFLAALAMLGLTTGMVMLQFIGSASAAVLFGVVLGASHGLFGAANAPIWARYFGRVHLGKIRGSIMTAGVAGSSLGPFVMGATFDLWGSFTPSIWLFVGLFAPFIYLALLAKPPLR